MSKLHIPYTVKPIQLLAPAADAAGRTGAFLTLKNAGRLYFLASIGQGNAATVQVSLLQATTVAGAGAKPVALAGPIYANLDSDASDRWVRQVDGVNFTTDAGLKNKMVLFQVDPALLDVNAGFDCIGVATGPSNAANITSVLALLTDMRFADQNTTARVD